MVVWWDELGEVENEHISHNYILFVIFVQKLSKLVEIRRSSEKTILHSFLKHSSALCMYASLPIRKIHCSKIFHFFWYDCTYRINYELFTALISFFFH